MGCGSLSRSGLRVGIAGAGVLGRLLAWQAAQAGHAVSVFDPAPGAQPQPGGLAAAGFSAAGMLSPLAELDSASAHIARLGLRSLTLWQHIVGALPQAPFFRCKGSLLLAHRNDLGSAQRVLARLQHAPAEMPAAQALSPAALSQLEPALHGAAHAWLLPGEGQIDPVGTLMALHDEALRAGVQWHWNTKVEQLMPQQLWLAGQAQALQFDLVIDARGLGARDGAANQAPERSDPQARLRGVRGETIWLHAPGHGLGRPVRLLHPRMRVYVVPRPHDTVVIGASEIESEDYSAVTVRSALELMSAAYSIFPALAEARIVRLDANLRPAYPDNEPRIHAQPGMVRINGLFRHGWLLAPALIEQALSMIDFPWTAAQVPCATMPIQPEDAVLAEGVKG